MLAKFMQREKRFIKNEKVAFLILPLVLVPILFETLLYEKYIVWFGSYQDEVLTFRSTFAS